MNRFYLAASICRQISVSYRYSSCLVIHPVLTATPTKEDLTRFIHADIFCRFLRETGETANLQALELTGQPENNQKLIEQFGIKCVSEKTDIENAAISTFLQLLENGKVIKSDSLVWRHPVSGDIVPKPVEKSSALPVTTKDFIMESKSYRYTVEGQNETIPERV